MKSRFLGSLALAVLVCCSSGGGGSDDIPLRPVWYNLQRLPTSSHLRAVRVANANQALVAGEATSIFRTDDGGASWYQMQHHPYEAGGDVLALDTLGTESVAVGRDGGGTGGRHWKAGAEIAQWFTSSAADPDPSDSGAPYTAVDMVLLDVFYILRRNGTILRVSGSTGTTATVHGSEDWHTVDFLGITGKGIAAGSGNLVKITLDNGANWSAQSLPVSAPVWRKALLFQKAATTEVHAYVCGDNGKIVKSTNADQSPPTWSDVSIGTTTATLRSISFLSDSLTGWVVGDGGGIWKTTNGGSSWTPQGSGVTPHDLHDVYFIDANVGYAVGDYGTVLKTLDGGANWQNITQGSRTRINALDFALNAERGIAVGPGGFVAKTLDGGLAWTSATLSGVSDLHGVSVPRQGPGTVAYACGDGGKILKNADFSSGDTWTAQTVPSSAASAPLRAILFPGNDLKGFCVGDVNTLLVTADGGATAWTEITLPGTSVNYASLAASPDGTVIAAGGQNGKVVFSLDGGTTWNDGSISGVGGTIATLQVPDNSTIVAGSSDGDIRRGTIAAGSPPSVSWGTTINLPGNVPPTGLAFRSSTRGLAVVAAGPAPDLGRIYVTEDGASWSISPEHTNWPLRTVWLNASGIGYAAGDEGTILKTFTGGRIP